MPYSASSRTRTGGITGVKPPLLEKRQRPLHERQLQPHERPLQVHEARAGHARGRARCRGRRPAARRGLRPVLAGLAHLADDLVLAGGASDRAGSAAPASTRRGGPPACAAPRSELLLALGRAARLGDRLRGVLAAPLQLADPLAGLVLARAQRPPAWAAARGGARRARAPRPARPGPRRGGRSETRAGCGSSRICLRSSIATPPAASCSCPSTCRGSRPPLPPGGRSPRSRA